MGRHKLPLEEQIDHTKNRISLQLPKGLLEELNAVTKDVGKSRNKFIVKLIIKALQK